MAQLILVPTPIGNLADITQRAAQVLRDAETVAAEDTRHSGSLLRHLGITRPLVRLDAHTIASRATRLLEAEGRLAYMTDAGTPGISDPGAELVRMALTMGLKVEVLPGATAFVPAVVLSGLDTARFTFEGFLPRKGSSRNARLQAISQSTATSIMYESPRRVADTLSDLIEHCGPDRLASVSRELSKLHEETVRGTLHELVAAIATAEPRGEYVICLEGRAPEADSSSDGRLQELLALLSGAGLGRREVRAALELAGASRNDAYELSLTVQGADLQ